MLETHHPSSMGILMQNPTNYKIRKSFFSETSVVSGGFCLFCRFCFPQGWESFKAKIWDPILFIFGWQYRTPRINFLRKTARCLWYHMLAKLPHPTKSSLFEDLKVSVLWCMLKWMTDNFAAASASKEINSRSDCNSSRHEYMVGEGKKPKKILRWKPSNPFVMANKEDFMENSIVSISPKHSKQEGCTEFLGLISSGENKKSTPRARAVSTF